MSTTLPPAPASTLPKFGPAGPWPETQSDQVVFLRWLINLLTTLNTLSDNTLTPIAAEVFGFQPKAIPAESLSLPSVRLPQQPQAWEDLSVLIPGVTSKAVDFLNALSAQGLVQKPTPPPQALNLTLTTTGTSGASTLVGTTLNIPIYAGGGSSNLTVYSSTGSSGTLSSIGTSIQTFNKVLALTSSTVTAAGTILRVRGSIQVSNGAATPYSLFVLVGVFPTSSAYVEMAYPFYVAPSVSGAVITVDLECKCQSVGTSSVIYVNGLATMAQGSGAGVQQTFPIGGTLTTNVSTWSSQSLALGVAANVASSLSATLYDVTYSIITPTGTI